MNINITFRKFVKVKISKKNLYFYKKLVQLHFMGTGIIFVTADSATEILFILFML